MNNRVHELVPMLLTGHVSSVWPIAVASIGTAAVLRWTAPVLEAMPPGSSAQRRLGFAACAVPAVVFCALFGFAPHLMAPMALKSAACFAHCAVLAAVFGGVGVRVAVRLVRQQFRLTLLLRLSQPPSERLRRVASGLGLGVLELPTQEVLCCTAGVCRPKILVSRGALGILSDEELRAALLHERAHLRARETLWVSVAALLNELSLMPVPRVLEAFRSAGEYAADREAVREVDSATLASALLQFSRYPQRPEKLAISLSGGASVVSRARLLLAAPEAHVAGARAVAGAGMLALALGPALLPPLVRWAGEVWCRF